jgi:hypothetical protein
MVVAKREKTMEDGPVNGSERKRFENAVNGGIMRETKGRGRERKRGGLEGERRK